MSEMVHCQLMLVRGGEEQTCGSSFMGDTLEEAYGSLAEHVGRYHPEVSEACDTASENGESCPNAPRECPKCVREARSHGIPLSVILGRTKLTDHFSQSYIDEQARPRSAREAAWEDSVDDEDGEHRFERMADRADMERKRAKEEK